MDFRSILQQAAQAGSGTPQAVTYAPGADLGVWNQAPVLDQNTGQQLYSMYDWNHRAPGDTYQTGYMDPNGSFQGLNHTVQNDNWQQGLALAAMGALGAYYLPGMMASAGAGGGVGAAVDPMMYGGTGAATWGAPEAAAGVGGVGGAAGAVGGAAPAVGGAAGAAPAVGAAAAPGAVAPAVGGSALSSLASSLGMSPGLLNGALALGGAALGSQGVKKTQTETLAPWLMPYAQKQMGYASGLLDQQMSPQYMQAANDIRSQATGLLSPQQSTNFGRFFPGH